MTGVLWDIARALRSEPIFAFYVVTTLAVAAVIGLITFDVIDLGMTHFGEAPHRTHDVAYGLLFTTIVVGVLAQLRRPRRNVSAMVVSLVPPAALLLAGLLTGDVDTIVEFNPVGRYTVWVVGVAALVHPAGRAFFRSFAIARADWPMVGMVAVAAVPLSAFAATNLDRQRSVEDIHRFMGHYGFIAALAFTIIGVGLLASLRADGWRVPAWVAGLLAVALGITSILYPDASSSVGMSGALITIAWGVVFIVMTGTRSSPGELSPGQSRRSRRLILPLTSQRGRTVTEAQPLRARVRSTTEAH